MYSQNEIWISLHLFYRDTLELRWKQVTSYGVSVFVVNILVQVIYGQIVCIFYFALRFVLWSRQINSIFDIHTFQTMQ